MSNVLAANGSFVPPADIDTNAKQLCKETERIIGVRGEMGEEGTHSKNKTNRDRLSNLKRVLYFRIVLCSGYNDYGQRLATLRRRKNGEVMLHNIDSCSVLTFKKN